MIAPWYRGQNGQCDFRVRIAEETLKRYPWTEPGKAVMPAPHYIFNGTWSIKPDGTISVNPDLKDWDNGDIGQRSFGLLLGLTDYYRYTGDPAAIGIITMTADYVLDYCQTPADHPWPRFFISCPTKGKAYGRADPHGFIQLDISAYVGSGMVAAYKLTGNRPLLGSRQALGRRAGRALQPSARSRAVGPLRQSRGRHVAAREHPDRRRGARLPISRRRDPNGIPRQRRFAGESPRRRRQIPSRRAAAASGTERTRSATITGTGTMEPTRFSSPAMRANT